MFLSIGFKQMVTQLTKLTVLSESCIDHVLGNDHNINKRVLKTDFSHHFGVLHETNFFVETITAKKEAATFRNFKKALKSDDYCFEFLCKFFHVLQNLIIMKTIWKSISIGWMVN